MLSAYDHRLVLFYLSNAVSHLRYRAEAAKDLPAWLLNHENDLKFRYPQTLKSVTAVAMWHGSSLLKKEPPLEWQRLAETLRNEFAAARQARPDRTAKRLRRLARAVGLTPDRYGDPGPDAALRHSALRRVDDRLHFFLNHGLEQHTLKGGKSDFSVPCLGYRPARSIAGLRPTRLL